MNSHVVDVGVYWNGFIVSTTKNLLTSTSCLMLIGVEYMATSNHKRHNTDTG